VLFNSFIFLIFLALVVPAYYLLPRRFRNLFLLACSYVFYGYWDYRFLSLILISTILDFTVGRVLHRTEEEGRRKLLLFISVAGNLGLLGFFKYFNFFVDSFAGISSMFGWEPDFFHMNILIPVGISFYTFQTMSYTLDIYRKRLEPSKSFIDFALFVAFFPQLVAGPIERASHLLPQIQSKPTATRDDFREGFALMTTGLFRKIIIGDTCGRIVDQIFADPSLFSSGELLMGVLLFATQVYADFSGYSNIARGTARFFGVHIMVNFEQPYMSANITELWQRWHISLSSWLRDYVYISMGGNRKGTKRTYFNLMFTMVLCGLWHGAKWTFVFWGFLQGMFLAIHKFMLKGKRATTGFVYTNVPNLIVYIAKVVGTHVLFLLGLVFFRSESFGMAWHILRKMVFWVPGDHAGQIVLIVVVYYAMTLLLDMFEYMTKDHAFLARVRPSYRLGLYAATWLVTLIYLFQAPPMPFVYFQF
jgi:D-alanyl-lipoteichoic acid acyltransferase DltB (MBOAT superfamily)